MRVLTAALLIVATLLLGSIAYDLHQLAAAPRASAAYAAAWSKLTREQQIKFLQKQDDELGAMFKAEFDRPIRTAR